MAQEVQFPGQALDSSKLLLRALLLVRGKSSGAVA